MGFPVVYSSDQGREFVNKVEKLFQNTKAAHRISSVYYPQTNGLVEKFNKTIRQLILKVCSESNMIGTQISRKFYFPIVL